ncbi:hypothetical protein JST97_25265 [bacterium]|nr:hypothetical protein [bacterium]
MSLLLSLKENFAPIAIGSEKAPQNLNELRSRLQDAAQVGRARPDLAYYCHWYAEFLDHLRHQEDLSMLQTRGKPRRMWAEQSLIYLDLTQCLRLHSSQMLGWSQALLQEKSQEFGCLLDELAEALEEMKDWNEGCEARCLNCGWSGQVSTCPHCRFHLLKPVRQYGTQQNSYVRLAPLQANLFQAITSVLEGQCDLLALEVPLELMQSRYQKALEEAEANLHLPLAQQALQSIPRALSGLREISRVFQDFDAQHLEDGWSILFQADQALQSNPASPRRDAGSYCEMIVDQVTLTNE